MNKNIINIKTEKNEIMECEVILTANYEKTGKDYIIFTDHKLDDYGNTVAYAKIYDVKGEDLTLYPIKTDDEWDMLQTLLSSCQKTALKRMKEESDK